MFCVGTARIVSGLLCAATPEIVPRRPGAKLAKYVRVLPEARLAPAPPASEASCAFRVADCALMPALSQSHVRPPPAKEILSHHIHIRCYVWHTSSCGYFSVQRIAATCRPNFGGHARKKALHGTDTLSK
ncbi:hypothetical protein C8J57DRAFT_1226226 [Mycena rebaudengoi]|nr:hypothetical protein C8J57DRAFT_1226226 [Mycena rebaudengoi]